MLPIAKEGLNLIVVFLIMSLMSYIAGLWVLGTIFFIISSFLIFFFRYPKRKVDLPPHIITSPADGKILSIEEVEENSYLGDMAFKISIFLSLFNVHVTRIPLNSEVEKTDYKKGTFKPAFSSKSSKSNEQNMVFLKNENIKLIVKQIAGIIARRIVCNVEPKSIKRRGDKLGIIKFGSRVELYVPKSVILKVNVGQKVKGGKTIIGELVTT